MGQNSKPKELTELIKVVIDSSYFLYMHIQKLLSVALIVRLALVKLRGGASMVAFLVSRSFGLFVYFKHKLLTERVLSKSYFGT